MSLEEKLLDYNLTNNSCVTIDELSKEEIKGLIAQGVFANQDVIDYYRNDQWDDEIN